LSENFEIVGNFLEKLKNRFSAMSMVPGWMFASVMICYAQYELQMSFLFRWMLKIEEKLLARPRFGKAQKIEEFSCLF
jgi:hypothetical protein